MTKRLIAIFSSLVLLGCSGGSTTNGASIGSIEESLLVVDTEAASDTMLRARISVIALERPDGSLTPNLLTEETEITIADPTGTVAGLSMLDVPPDLYVAMHLLLVDGSVTATQGGQPIAVAPASPQQRVDFGSEALEAHGGTPLMLAHDSPLELMNGVWQPSWVVRSGNQRLLRADVEIVSLDLRNRSGVGRVRSLRERLFELDFSETRGLARGEVLRRLQVGAVIRVAATIVSARTLAVLALLSGQEPRGMRHALQGVIAAIRAAQGEFDVADGRGGVHPVATDSSTLYTRVTNGGRQPITFADLAVDDRIEVVARRSRTGNAVPTAELVIVDERTSSGGGSNSRR